MKNSVFALGFATSAAIMAATSHGALAQDKPTPADAAFVRLDADKSGDISLEEFVGALNTRVSTADKDSDGKATVAEIAATFKGEAADDRAGKFVKRFDADSDGAVTVAELETWRKARFAKLDANSDGKLAKEEVLKRAEQ